MRYRRYISAGNFPATPLRDWGAVNLIDVETSLNYSGNCKGKLQHIGRLVRGDAEPHESQ